MNNQELIYKLRKERITYAGQQLAADALEALLAENARLRREVDCPYQRGTIARELMLWDWSNMTIDEIAAALHSTYNNVSTTIAKIKKETGYIVPHRRKQRSDAEV